MKSVKPGRGPSMMGGVASVFAVVFGIIWMCGAASMGAPGFFLLFGVAFIGIGVVNAVYSFKNAAGENPRRLGTPGAIRTRDLPLRRRMLYPAELRRHI